MCRSKTGSAPVAPDADKNSCGERIFSLSAGGCRCRPRTTRRSIRGLWRHPVAASHGRSPASASSRKLATCHCSAGLFPAQSKASGRTGRQRFVFPRRYKVSLGGQYSVGGRATWQPSRLGARRRACSRRTREGEARSQMEGRTGCALGATKGGTSRPAMECALSAEQLQAAVLTGWRALWISY